MTLLDAIHDPAALRRLRHDQLPEVAADLREALLHSVAKTGGHLSANLGTVELEKVVTAGDKAELHALVQAHHKYTKSAVAGQLLTDWPSSLTQFVKVMPVDYKRVLAERKQHDAEQEAVVHVGR